MRTRSSSFVRGLVVGVSACFLGIATHPSFPETPPTEEGSQIEDSSSVDMGSALTQGRYVVVDARRSSSVAGGPGDDAASELLGREVVLGNGLTWLDGAQCESWSVAESTTLEVDLRDRRLSDLALGPVDGPTSLGDARIGRAIQLLCGNEAIGEVFVVDDRTLVSLSPSGLSHLILERPLSAPELARFQAQLQSMKFYSGDVTGRWNEATQRAVAAYAEYRGARYRFRRAAVTSNLLDGLRVVENPPSALEEIKTVYGPAGVVAHFFGRVPILAPRSTGVQRLAFTFGDDARQHELRTQEEPAPDDWTFDLFSWGGTWVLLPAGRGGPYHIVAIEDLRDYLSGAAAPEHVVTCPRASQPAEPPVFVSDHELELPSHCCDGPAPCRRVIGRSPPASADPVSEIRDRRRSEHGGAFSGADSLSLAHVGVRRKADSRAERNDSNGRGNTAWKVHRQKACEARGSAKGGDGQ